MRNLSGGKADQGQQTIEGGGIGGEIHGAGEACISGIAGRLRIRFGARNETGSLRRGFARVAPFHGKVDADMGGGAAGDLDLGVVAFFRERHGIRRAVEQGLLEPHAELAQSEIAAGGPAAQCRQHAADAIDDGLAELGARGIGRVQMQGIAVMRGGKKRVAYRRIYRNIKSQLPHP